MTRTLLLNAFNNDIPELREYDRFQELAFHVARAKWTGLRLTRKNNDRGADAIDHSEGLILACGWNGDLNKLRKDCETITKERPECKKVIFVTSTPYQENQIAGWGEKISKLGLKLVEVLHRDALIGELLRPEQRWIAHEFLNLPISDFADLATHLPGIRAGCSRIVQEWTGLHLDSSIPNLDLGVSELTPQKQIELRSSEIPDLLTQGRVAWLTGVPGAGKTYTLVETARALLERENGPIPILVSLRQWSLQDDDLLSFITSIPALLQQGVSSSTIAVAIESTNAVLCLNGWNEIPANKRERLSRELSTLFGQFSGVIILITCREIENVSWQRASEHWKIERLSDQEIRDALKAFDDSYHPESVEKILEHPQLSSLARVPLFLWEIAKYRETPEGIPDTRFTLLEGLVKRACSEHRDSLLIENDDKIANRFIQTLAERMCDHNVTALTASEAREVIATTTKVLSSEHLLSFPHNATQILRQLTSCHLLVSEDSEVSFQFSHQIIQEYFASLSLAAQYRDSKEIEQTERLTSSAWEQAIHLAIESLCRTISIDEASQLTLDYSKFNFEGACRVIGANPVLWESIGAEFETAICSRLESNDINLNWLGARSAAATGQNCFSDSVFIGLRGIPEGSGNPYAGINPTCLFRTLGENVHQRIVALEDEDHQLHAFRNLIEPISQNGREMAIFMESENLPSALRDEVDRMLLKESNPEFFTRFVARVEDNGGWTTADLRLARYSPIASLKALRSAYRKILKSRENAISRMKVLNQWTQFDEAGSASELIAEYTWATSQTDDPNFQGYLQQILRRASKSNESWAAEVFRKLLKSPTFKLKHSWPWALLTYEETSALVASKLMASDFSSKFIQDDFQVLAQISPRTTARTVLKLIASSPRPAKYDSEGMRFKDALREISWEAIVVEACDDEFKNPGPNVDEMIDGLMRAIPEFKKSENLGEAECGKWHHRLHHWTTLLPPISSTSDSVWSNIATLLSQLKIPSDVPFIIRCLKGDHEKIEKQTKQRKEEIERARSTGGSLRISVTPCSYEFIYYRALRSYEGYIAAEAIWPLIEEPRFLTFAANWLATYLGAPISGESQFAGRGYQYHLIFERRSRPRQLELSSKPILEVLEAEIDVICREDFSDQNSRLAQLFVIVARLRGEPAGPWILDKLEQPNCSGSWNEVLHSATLAGAAFSNPGTVENILISE